MIEGFGVGVRRGSRRGGEGGGEGGGAIRDLAAVSYQRSRFFLICVR